MKATTTIVLSWAEAQIILKEHLVKRLKGEFPEDKFMCSVGYNEGVDRKIPVDVTFEFNKTFGLFEAPPVAPSMTSSSETVKQQKRYDICNILLSPIDTPELDFSVKTINLLKEMGLEYVWQIVVVSERALTYHKGFGSKSLENVYMCLAVKGIFPDLGYKLRTLLISDLEVPLNDDYKTDLAVISTYSNYEKFQVKVQVLLASKISQTIT